MWHLLSFLSGGIKTTVELTVVSFLIGAVVAIPLAALRRSRLIVLKAPVVFVVEVVRAVPPIVWLFIVYYALGSDVQLSAFQAAAAGLGLISAAHLSEIYRAGLEALPAGQWDAVKALSLPPLASFRNVILPQAIVIIVPPAATFAIGLLKDTAVASVLGAKDITFLANQQTQTDLNGLNNFALAGAMYIVLSIPIAVVARSTDRLLTRRLVSA